MTSYRPRGRPKPALTTIPPRSEWKDRKLFLNQVLRAYNGGKKHRPMTVQEIADVLGVSWATAYGYLRDAGAVFRGRGPDKDKDSSRAKRQQSHPKGSTDGRS